MYNSYFRHSNILSIVCMSSSTTKTTKASSSSQNNSDIIALSHWAECHTYIYLRISSYIQIIIIPCYWRVNLAAMMCGRGGQRGRGEMVSSELRLPLLLMHICTYIQLRAVIIIIFYLLFYIHIYFIHFYYYYIIIHHIEMKFLGCFSFIVVIAVVFPLFSVYDNHMIIIFFFAKLHNIFQLHR